MSANSIRREVSKRLSKPSDRISISYFTARKLVREVHTRPSFGAHLADEGRFVYCINSCHDVQNWLNGKSTPRADQLAAELEREVESLRLFADTARFNQDFVPSLARIYSVARSVLIIKLLQANIHEYSWRRIFEKFGALHPELQEELARLSDLRRYYELLIGRLGELHESEPHSSAEAITKSISAIQAIASAEQPRELVE